MRREVFLLVICGFLLIQNVISVVPKPNKMEEGHAMLKFNKCGLEFVDQNSFNNDVQRKMDEYYQYFIQNQESCSESSEMKDLKIHAQIEDQTMRRMTLTTQETYRLVIQETGDVQITSQNYVGFIRALETLHQLIRRKSKDHMYIENVPIIIEDEPYLPHRGIMIDTARHFLPLSAILRTLDAMMYNKLNVLHIHITDDESFPIWTESIPEIPLTARFSSSQGYSIDDIKSIINRATQNGIRVIPEIDSPGHARSWGLSAETAPIMILCPGQIGYNGQLDPTMNQTYEVNKKIFTDIQALFPEEFIHMGGDEVSSSCWNKRPSINEWMQQNNISDYTQLQIYYRNRQLEFLNQGKIPIYWSNEDIHIPPGPTGVIQFWGNYNTLGLISNISNKVILSPQDYYYINTGLGFIWGNDFQDYKTWKWIYDMNPVSPDLPRERILGGEVTLWGEVSDLSTLDNYLWIRSSAMAERLWTEKKSGTLDVVKRLVNLEKTMIARGVEVSPVTRQYCENNPDQCFTN